MNLEVKKSVAIATHELMAPVILIRQMALCFSEVNPEQTREYKEKIIEIAEKSLHQIEDISRIAEIEQEMFTTEPIEVRSVCEEVEEELRTLFTMYGKEIELNFQNHKKLVIANRELLYSIIYNFCLNSINYAAEDNTLKLIIKDQKQGVRVGIRDFGPMVPLRVSEQIERGEIDSGLKIPLRPDSSGWGIYAAGRFARAMGAKIGTIIHRDGMTFFVELKSSKQGMLF